MDSIHSTLKNFSVISEINEIFPNTKGFEYTKKGVIRAVKKPSCDCCDKECIRNGWDPLTRQGLFMLKIGKFLCQNCQRTIRSDLSFWEQFISKWEETISSFFLRLADKDVALRAISEVMNFVIPMSKDSVMRRIFSAVKTLVIPTVQTEYQIVHYDEQHPKKGRQQKYRLTLICAITRTVIADELFDNKEHKTIKNFLETHLDVKKETIIITDDCPWYETIFEEIWGKNAKHQLCILHLNKLIVKDCGKLKSLQEIYNTYLLLDIFYDRTKDLLFLETLLKEQESVSEKEMKEWLKTARNRFNTFVRSLEKMRRREKKNMTLRTFDDAKNKFATCKEQCQFFPKELQKRLRYIEKRWEQFTLFYMIKDCPHTNNVIENYFSTSLKTHRKKQLRTDAGLKNKMNLSRYKKNVGFSNPVTSFLEWGKNFWILKT